MNTQRPVVELTIQCPPGEVRYFAHLYILLNQDIDEMEQYGSAIVSDFAYLLDTIVDNLHDDDKPEFKKQIERIHRRTGYWEE